MSHLPNRRTRTMEFDRAQRRPYLFGLIVVWTMSLTLGVLTYLLIKTAGEGHLNEVVPLAETGIGMMVVLFLIGFWLQLRVNDINKIRSLAERFLDHFTHLKRLFTDDDESYLFGDSHTTIVALPLPSGAWAIELYNADDEKWAELVVNEYAFYDSADAPKPLPYTVLNLEWVESILEIVKSCLIWHATEVIRARMLAQMRSENDSGTE